jgi:hypothetical protein
VGSGARITGRSGRRTCRDERHGVVLINADSDIWSGRATHKEPSDREFADGCREYGDRLSVVGDGNGSDAAGQRKNLAREQRVGWYGEMRRDGNHDAVVALEGQRAPESIAWIWATMEATTCDV